MKNEVETSSAEGKGQHHPSHGHSGGLDAHSHQLVKLALQTSKKKESEQA